MQRHDPPDWLADRLRQVDLADDGFSDRVVHSLPPKAPRRSVRSWVLLGATVVAGLLVFFLLPTGEYLLDAVDRVFTLDVLRAVSVGSLMAVAAVIWGVVSLSLSEG